MLEDHRPRIGDRLQFERDGTLQPVRQHLLRVTNEEVQLAGGQRLFHQGGDAHVIVLPLDDHLGQTNAVVGAGDEAPNEDVLDGRLRGAQAALQVGWIGLREYRTNKLSFTIRSIPG